MCEFKNVSSLLFFVLLPQPVYEEPVLSPLGPTVPNLDAILLEIAKMMVTGECKMNACLWS